MRPRRGVGRGSPSAIRRSTRAARLWSAFYHANHWRIVTLAEWRAARAGRSSTRSGAAAGWSSNDWKHAAWLVGRRPRRSSGSIAWPGPPPHSIATMGRLAERARLAGLNRVVIERLLAGTGATPQSRCGHHGRCEFPPTNVVHHKACSRSLRASTWVSRWFSRSHRSVLIAPLEATLMMAVLVTIGACMSRGRRLVIGRGACGGAAGLAARQAGLVVSQPRADQDQREGDRASGSGALDAASVAPRHARRFVSGRAVVASVRSSSDRTALSSARVGQSAPGPAALSVRDASSAASACDLC